MRLSTTPSLKAWLPFHCAKRDRSLRSDSRSCTKSCSVSAPPMRSTPWKSWPITSKLSGCVFQVKRWKVRLASLTQEACVIWWRAVSVSTSVVKLMALSSARWSPKSLISSSSRRL